MAKPSVSPPNILLVWTVSLCHYITLPKFACFLLYNVHAVKLAVSPMPKFRGRGGWTKARQPFSAVGWPKLPNLGACWGVPVDWHASFRLLISGSVADRDMFGQSSKSVPNSGFFAQPVGVNAHESSNQIVKLAAMCPSLVEIRWVTSEIRSRNKKEEKQKQR